jgi:hypothetical protein
VRFSYAEAMTAFYIPPAKAAGYASMTIPEGAWGGNQPEDYQLTGFRSPSAASGLTTHRIQGPDTEPLAAKTRNLETFAQKLIAKV